MMAWTLIVLKLNGLHILSIRVPTIPIPVVNIGYCRSSISSLTLSVGQKILQLAHADANC